MMKTVIGVAAFQGDVEEHLAMTRLALNKLGIDGEVTTAKRPAEFARLSGLIIPGGESTVIGRLSSYNESLQVMRSKIGAGMPTLGTCAGLITLARQVYDRVVGDTDQPLVAALDVVAERNSFGRQRESFEADVDIPILGERKFRGVFIRSPVIKEVGPSADILSRINQEVIAIKQNNIIGTSFHPELSGDTRLHEYFVGLTQKFHAF